MGDFPVEKQIQMLFAAFDIANPGVATFQEFLDYCLDTYGLDEFMNSLEELMDDLMYKGVPVEERSSKKSETAGGNSEGLTWYELFKTAYQIG